MLPSTFRELLTTLIEYSDFVEYPLKKISIEDIRRTVHIDFYFANRLSNDSYNISIRLISSTTFAEYYYDSKDVPCKPSTFISKSINNNERRFHLDLFRRIF